MMHWLPYLSIWLTLVLVVFVNSRELDGTRVLQVKPNGVCTIEDFEEEGRKRIRNAHVTNQWMISNQCETLSFFDYQTDPNLPQRIRRFTPEKMLTHLVRALEDSFRIARSIRVLRFGHCGIRDEHVPLLLNVLLGSKSNMQGVQEIHLNGNHLSDVGAIALANGLKGGAKKISVLRTLYLDRNNIGYSGVQSIVNMAASSGLCSSLHLQDNPVWGPSNKDMGKVMDWLTITEEGTGAVTVTKGPRARTIEVLIGGYRVTQAIAVAGAAEKEKRAAATAAARRGRGGREAANSASAAAVTSSASSSSAVIDHEEGVDIAKAEIALLEKGLSGTRTVLEPGHVVLQRYQQGRKDRHSANIVSEQQPVEWEQGSGAVMSMFVKSCVDAPAVVLREYYSGDGVSDKDAADAFALYLQGLGYDTPSMLIQLDPSDLRDHLAGSPDLLVKVVLRCTCEYYTEFKKLADAYARGASADHQVVTDLVDDPRAMHMNYKLGPYFVRTKSSVRSAGGRIANLGTGGPHKNGAKYRHTDHHLANVEPTLYDRSVYGDVAVAARSSRQPKAKGGALDFTGYSGMYDSYAGAMRGEKYTTTDALWRTSYCAAPYFRSAVGVPTVRRGAGAGTGAGSRDGNRRKSKRGRGRGRKKGKEGKVLHDEF
jgi:hypothetical protein